MISLKKIANKNLTCFFCQEKLKIFCFGLKFCLQKSLQTFCRTLNFFELPKYGTKTQTFKLELSSNALSLFAGPSDSRTTKFPPLAPIPSERHNTCAAETLTSSPHPRLPGLPPQPLAAQCLGRHPRPVLSPESPRRQSRLGGCPTSI